MTQEGAIMNIACICGRNYKDVERAIAWLNDCARAQQFQNRQKDLSDLADLAKSISRLHDYDRQENHTRQKEQMKARIRYMNKHQWNYKK